MSTEKKITLKSYYQALDGRHKFIEELVEKTGLSVCSIRHYIHEQRQMPLLVKKVVAEVTNIPIENL